MTAGSIPCFSKLALLVFILLAIPLNATANTYSCTGVDKKANLGIASGSVNISSHDKICDFAVDGVSPTGKQSPDFVNLMNQVLSGSFRNSTMDADSLFSLVLGPFFPDRPDSSVMSSFRNSFGTSARDIGNCLASFQQSPGSSGGPRITRDDSVCRVLDPGDVRRGSDNMASFGMIEARVDQPTLQIGLNFNRQSYLLFIPVRLIGAGINGYRLGR
jgi:hypothetical protein